MIELNISELNKFMGMLLKSEDFDSFFLKEGLVRNYMDYSFDGELHSEWYDTAELEKLSLQKYVDWGSIRGHIFDLIKGSHTPLAMQFKLIAPKEITQTLLEKENSTPGETVLLNLSISFKEGKLFVITGVYRSGFSLSKTLDNLWDSYVTEWFKQKTVMYEVM